MQRSALASTGDAPLIVASIALTPPLALLFGFLVYEISESKENSARKADGGTASPV